MGKIYCLLGKSAVGKSTIEKELSKLGLKRIISSTTRPMRSGEAQGVDYNYINNDEFYTLLNNGTLLEHTCYRDWHYCIDKRYNQLDLDGNDYVCVVEPYGYKQIIHNIGRENVVGIYLYISDKERLLRSLSREEEPDCYEVCRRFISDEELFNGIESKVDYVIYNKNVDDTVRLIAENIGVSYTSQDIIIPKLSKVKILKINNPNAAKHLEEYIGREGYVLTNHIIKNNIRRYKISFLSFQTQEKESETAYFRYEELEVIE